MKQCFPKLNIVLSSCLEGRTCRYNGRHAKDSFVCLALSSFAEFIVFCPESEVIGIPREPINLFRIDETIQVLGSETNINYTAELDAYNETFIEGLGSLDIDAAIVKSKSPSCGLHSIKVHPELGSWQAEVDGFDQGLFSKALQRNMPHIAIIDEQQLQEVGLREAFLIQAFALARWHKLKKTQPLLSELQNFHRDTKYLLMAKSPETYKTLGAAIANVNPFEMGALVEQYQDAYYSAMAEPLQKGRLVNAMDHMLGYFKSQITKSEREVYSETVDRFREGEATVLELSKLIQLLLSQYGSPYLSTQYLLHPYPEALMTR